MTQDITSLIEKLEGAEAGSRELDCRVVAWNEGVIGGEHWSDGDIAYALTDPDRTCNPAPVTTSLDAALALAERALPGIAPGVSKNVFHGYWSAWLHQNVDKACHVVGDASTSTTPALALCAAILRAKQ